MTREKILDDAKRIVTGRREQDYGSPEKSFTTIANLWSAYLGESIKPDDVAMMMILLKIARAKNGTGTEDCFVDIAGYAACGGEVWAGLATKANDFDTKAEDFDLQIAPNIMPERMEGTENSVIVEAMTREGRRCEVYYDYSTGKWLSEHGVEDIVWWRPL